MRKSKITVYDYDDARHNSCAWHHSGNNIPVKIYEVEAWCVGGKEGIKAYFIIDGMLYTASGDDGHWWLVNVCAARWLGWIKEAITAIEEDHSSC